MQELWKRKKATAREITDALEQSGEIAHSTVQTLLRRMEEKGAIGHEIVDRTFIYFPKVENENVVKTMLSDFIDNMFTGSASNMVSYLAKNELISPEELKNIIRMIDKKR